MHCTTAPTPQDAFSVVRRSPFHSSEGRIVSDSLSHTFCMESFSHPFLIPFEAPVDISGAKKTDKMCPKFLLKWGSLKRTTNLLWNTLFGGRECSACRHRMAHWKWKETKQQPSLLPGPAVPGCSLVSFHFLWQSYVRRLYFQLVKGSWLRGQFLLETIVDLTTGMHYVLVYLSFVG